jgi:ACR3 family arsenite efflux pump ArsB
MIFIWAFVLAVIPVPLGLFALAWRKNPPADIGIYGYRTKLSMRSKESWDYAHKLCAKLFPRYNLILLIASEIVLFIGYAISKDHVMIIAICLLVIQTVLVFLMCIQIDRALKEKFG